MNPRARTLIAPAAAAFPFNTVDRYPMPDDPTSRVEMTVSAMCALTHHAAAVGANVARLAATITGGGCRSGDAWLFARRADFDYDLVAYVLHRAKETKRKVHDGETESQTVFAGPPPTRRQGRIRLQGACPGKGPPTMAKKAPTSSKSAKKPTKPGPALRGGTSCFNEDGSPVVAVWKALCETKKSSDIVVTKLANRTKDRKAIELELREMDEGDEQYAEKTKQHWQVCEEIKGLRADRDQFISRYGRIIELTNANKLPAAASPSEIFRLADESEEGEEEGDDPQLKIASALPGVRPDHLYAQWAQAFPSLFGHREGGALKPHFDKLYDPDRSSPLKLMRVIAEGFANCKTSKDRRELLPGPPWFNAGLMAVMAKAATAETCKGDAVGETGAGEVLGFMQACAAKDIDAWLDLVGGKDAPANKVLLLEASA